MCGRYAVSLPHQMMGELFRVTSLPPVVPRYNVAPTQPILAIWEDHGERAGHLARWGFVPHWVKDPREFPLLVNARAEGIATKPAFRDALRRQRCIVPASGYYEWRTDGPRAKQPFYITMADDIPMALAGLWSSWAGPNGEEVDTVATITVDANAQLSVIHDRMPAILVGDEIEAWLDTAHLGSEAAQLAHQLPDGVLKFHPVSKRVNSARDDDEGLIEPIVEEKREEAPAAEQTEGQLKLF
jgi:putative SOS response-associated peptidase YedK